MDDIIAGGFSPSPLNRERVVFNINGNHFRLITAVDFNRKALYVLWFGTHAEYDQIDALKVTFSK